MRKRMIGWLSVIMIASFAASAAITVVSEAKPPCNRCKKDGCPSGFCYVDCVGCCYEDAQYGVVCFR